MQDIAEELRHRREEMGKSLEDAQSTTKIRLRYLQALEAAEPEQIPGEVYIKGFLRSYGDYLGLDGWALVERYKAWRRSVESEAEQESTQEPPAEGVPSPSPVPRIMPRAYAVFQRPLRSGQGLHQGKFDLAMRVGAVLLVLAVGFTIWVWSQGPSRQGQLPAGGPTATSTGPEVATPAPPAIATLPSTEPVTPGADQANTDRTVQPKPTPTGTQSVETIRTGRIVSYIVRGADTVQVRADLVGDCWVRVVGDGQEIYSGTLHAGDRQTWEGRQRIEVQAGLPVSLRLTVNGVTVESIDSREPINLSFRIGS